MRNMKFLAVSIVIITAMIIISAGCGGGDGGTYVSPVSSPEGGKFVVTVTLPGYGSKGNIEGSVIPYRYKKLAVHIDGENTDVDLGPVDISYPLTGSPPSFSHTFSGVPAGLNVATVKILDSNDTIIAQRKHGFILDLNGTVDSGNLNMGVVISGGNCVPSAIEVPVGTVLYYQNWDSTAQTVTMNDGKTTGSINAIGTAGQPATFETYSEGSITFGSAGYYTYTSPSATGYVLVYDYQSPVMKSITGGTFDMGSAANPPGIAEDAPVHPVTVSNFYMGECEVTWGEYCRFLNSQGNQTEGTTTWVNMAYLNPPSLGVEYINAGNGDVPGNFRVKVDYANRPVACVSWYGAVAYCNWLSEQEGLTPCYGPKDNRGNDPSVWRTKNGYR
ncbi:MAG: SUMF1/EgtB/PvdO family nonheme iron enzyme, partial [Nitrospirota bacterium]